MKVRCFFHYQLSPPRRIRAGHQQTPATRVVLYLKCNPFCYNQPTTVLDVLNKGLLTTERHLLSRINPVKDHLGIKILRICVVPSYRESSGTTVKVKPDATRMSSAVGADPGATWAEAMEPVIEKAAPNWSER